MERTTDRIGVAVVVLLLAATAEDARADEPISRPPLAEPIFTETVTDIDGFEPGEVEFDVNGTESVARRGGARLVQTSIVPRADGRLAIFFDIA